MRTPKKEILTQVYGEEKKSALRFSNIAEKFIENFGSAEMEFFSAPGRTELVGNHTDHNGGKVLAASIDMDTIGAAYPNGTDQIEIISEGYRDAIQVDLTALEQVPINQGTLSLVAGIVQGARNAGFQVKGFQAYVSTEVISSAGVSSSASFEMLLCAMINYFFNENKMTCVEYAKIGQYAENQYWSKASGLMDQMACAVGGTILLDFKQDVSYRKVDFSFDKIGYELVIINTGKGHADLSEEYSLVPGEMKQVASCMGVEQLADASVDKLFQNMKTILDQTENDRAVLRAVHFYEENERVDQMIEEVEVKQIQDRNILNIIEASGRSSWELLQNCYSLSNYKEQKITICLTLAERYLKKIQDGCCRVHGGGFAGVIACVVPVKNTQEFVSYMGSYVGEENVYPMKIRKAGAIHLTK